MLTVKICKLFPTWSNPKRVSLYPSWGLKKSILQVTRIIVSHPLHNAYNSSKLMIIYFSVRLRLCFNLIFLIVISPMYLIELFLESRANTISSSIYPRGWSWHFISCLNFNFLRPSLCPYCPRSRS